MSATPIETPLVFVPLIKVVLSVKLTVFAPGFPLLAVMVI